MASETLRPADRDFLPHTVHVVTAAVFVPGALGMVVVVALLSGLV